jgi:acetyl esterase/lipase
MKLTAMITVLVLHGGGFSGGDPASVEPIASDLRAAGYNAIAVPYRHENPTGNVLGEIATVRRYAKDFEGYGPVIAYGTSAGGTLAGALAASGDVAGAVVAGGPSNLLTWICVSPLTIPSYWQALGMTTADRRAASPYYRLSSRTSPQLLLYGDVDPIVTVDQGLSYYNAARKRQSDTKFTLMTISPHAFYEQYRVQARQWIQQRWPVRANARARPARVKPMRATTRSQTDRNRG